MQNAREEHPRQAGSELQGGGSRPDAGLSWPRVRGLLTVATPFHSGEREPAVLPLHAAQRAVTSWVLLGVSGALFCAGMSVPAISRASGVTLGDACLALGAFFIADTAGFISYRRFGGSSRVYRVLDCAESFVGSLSIAYVIHRSQSAVSFFWFFHFVHICLTAPLGLSLIYGFSLVLGPLGLMIAFAADGEVASAWICAVAGLLGLYVYLILGRVHGELESGRRREAHLRGELALARVNQERARISRDLHDHVAAELTALLWRIRELSGSAPSGARDELDALGERLRDAISELRNVVLSLRGAVLDRRSALALLERRCRELCAPLELDFQVLGEASSSRASELEVPSEDLLLIAFELVRNAAQHSDGRLLVVALDVRSGLVLRVVDDGRGLPRHLWQSSHGGLKNVRDRVRELGGSIALEPSASGTHVVVTFARCDAAGLDRELGESSRFDESNRNQRSSSTVASRSRVS